jgi:hypothetical protein
VSRLCSDIGASARLLAVCGRGAPEWLFLGTAAAVAEGFGFIPCCTSPVEPSKRGKTKLERSGVMCGGLKQAATHHLA